MTTNRDIVAMLQKADPDADFGATLKQLRAEAARAATVRLTTLEGVRDCFASARARAKVATDRHGGFNEEKDLDWVAYHMVRSEVYEALLSLDPTPPAHEWDEGDPDITWARQKAHGKKLWKQTDALVAAAGLVEPEKEKK